MRRTSLVVLAGLLGSLAVAAPAAAEEVHERPSDGRFTVQGHGWGHGRGMSQWGAQGAATLGRTADEITSTYYPGTAKGSLPDTPIRVWISADEGRDLDVAAAPGMRATDLATGRALDLPSGPTRWRVVVAGGTALQLQSLSGSTWTAQPVGGSTALAGPVQFSGPTFTRVALPGGSSRDYRGTVRAVRTGSALKTVVVLGLEDYLLGVVPREASSGWEPAALQAQAIAARSYSAYKRDRVRDGADYDICETTSCQVFGGSRLITSSGRVTELEPTSTTAAIRATRGVVRTWQGRPIFAEFSSSNGGWSTRGDVAYLAPREDPWDGVVRNSVHAWTATLTVAQIEKRFPSIGSFQRLRVTARDGNGEWGGRVTQVVLEGSRGRATTTGAGIHQAAPWPGTSTGLKSSWWRITAGTSSPAVAPPASRPVPLTSRVVQKSLTPTLVRHPGPAVGAVSVAVENTGTSAWPVSGLHLALDGGARDSIAVGGTRPGAYVGSRTRPGASSIEPGEVATFTVALDARRLPAGTHARSYRLRVGDGPLFGTAIAWPFRVVAPVLTAARAGRPSGTLSDGLSVVVPTGGSATVALPFRNTGSLTWPAGTVALGTSVPRNRPSASAGAGWTGSTRVGGLAAPVAPGETGSLDLVLHGNGLGPGVSLERVEPLWSGGGWLDGAVTSLVVVRTDPAAERLAMLHAAPRTVVVPRGREATAVVRLRNLGGTAWEVGREPLSSGSQHPLRTSAWTFGTRPPALALNANRPGAATVEPGEIGEWRVPFKGVRAGTYPTTLVGVGPSGVYGPRVGLSVVVR